MSNDIDKQPIPGQPNIEIRENERVIVQEDEEVQGERLLETVYDHGTFYFEGNDLDAIDAAKQRVKETYPQTLLPVRESERTTEVRKQAIAKLLQTAA